MQMQGNKELLDLIINYDKDMRGLIERKQLQLDEHSKPWFAKLLPLPQSLVVPGRNLGNGMNIGKPRIKQ